MHLSERFLGKVRSRLPQRSPIAKSEYRLNMKYIGKPSSAKPDRQPWQHGTSCRNLRLVLLLLLVGLMPGLGPTIAWSAEPPLRIAVSQTPLSLPFFVAEKNGYFRESGVPLRINKVIGGHRAMQAVLDGKADLATSSESVIMFTSFKTREFAVLATFVTSIDDVKIISRAGLGVDNPNQLSGKRVGTVLGAASHYYLDTLLLMNGVASEEVERVHLQPENMVESLRNGDVDAVSIWEPYPFMIINSVRDAQVLSNPGFYRLFFNLCVHTKHLGVRDDDLIKILDALERAQHFIATQPVEAQTILREYLQLDQSLVDWVWPLNNYHLSLDQALLTTLESEARWALQEGYVKGDQHPNYLDFIHSGPLQQVREDAVTVIK